MYEWIDAPLLLEHRGIKIYTTFKDDIKSKGQRMFIFGLSPDCSEYSHIHTFDIRTVARLLGYGTVVESIIPAILREAINSELLTQDGINREHYWFQRSNTLSWKWATEAVQNMGDIFYDPEDIGEDWGLDEKGEPEYPGDTPSERVENFAVVCVQKAIEKALERQTRANQRKGEANGIIA